MGNINIIEHDNKNMKIEINETTLVGHTEYDIGGGRLILIKNNRKNKILIGMEIEEVHNHEDITKDESEK